jgi:ABC-type transport system involved in cytochrome c biogenesis permease component
MRAVIAKELRQGQILLLFGPLFIALVGVLYVYLSRAYVRNSSDQENVDTACAVLMAVGAVVAPLLALAGAFAADQERGTLPLLLALPLSRLRIWSAKLVASVAIALAGIAVILLPGALVIPRAVDMLYLPARAWDLAIWWCFAVAVATLCSTYCERTLTALVNTILVGGALFVGVAGLSYFGASLLGYDELLDMELWLLAAAPALLLASLFTFSRGELLQTRRKLRLAFGAFLCCLVVIWGIVVGGTRLAVRYQRSAVKEIEAISMPSGGRALALRAMGSPIAYRRSLTGWTGAEPNSYRSSHTVVLDLGSGRELMVSSVGHVLALAAGRPYAAVAPARRGPLTYSATQSYEGPHIVPRDLDILDLRHHRFLSRPLADLPRNAYWRDFAQGEWSPDGSWLALGGIATEDRSWGEASEVVRVMRADGSQRRDISVSGGASYGPSRPWAWAPNSRAIYAIAPDGKLQRHRLPGGSAAVVWDFAKAAGQLEEGSTLGRGPRGVVLSASPDGKWIAAALIVPQQSPQPYALLLYAVAADGSGAQLIYEDAHTSGWPLEELALAWSGDGRRLYFRPAWQAVRRSPAALYRWRAGEAAAVPIALPTEAPPMRVAALSTGDMLVWSHTGTFLLDPADHLRPLAKSPEGYSLAGLDAEGRAILVRGQRPAEVAALDLPTGKLTRIYP